MSFFSLLLTLHQVSGRVATLRGKLKKATNALPSTLFALKKGDMAHVKWLQEGLRYIYPHNRAVLPLDSHMLSSRWRILSGMQMMQS